VVIVCPKETAGPNELDSVTALRIGTVTVRKSMLFRPGRHNPKP
jgi:hypothetical protein